jgi:hypothetical protein
LAKAGLFLADRTRPVDFTTNGPQVPNASRACDFPTGNSLLKKLAQIFKTRRIAPHDMNSASQTFPHHLAELRERMLHPTDYEKAVHYFLEEFAGDQAFIMASDVDSLPHLVAVLGHVASKAIGRRVELEGALVSHLREHKFVHGNAQADGRIVLFFYFLEGDTGVMMLIPGGRGQTDVARFHLAGGLTDPRKN